MIRIGELCLRTSEFPISTGMGENTGGTKRISQRGDLDVLRRSSLIQVKAMAKKYQCSSTIRGRGLRTLRSIHKIPLSAIHFLPQYVRACGEKKKGKRDEGFWSSGWRVCWLEPIDFRVSDPCFPIFLQQGCKRGVSQRYQL